MQKSLELDIRKCLATSTGVPIEEIAIMNITSGTVHFDVLIPAVYLTRNTAEENQIQRTIYDAKNAISQQFQRAYPNAFVGVDVVLTQLKDQFTFCPGDFDKRGDFKFPKATGETQRRGNLPYYQPSKSWKRYGLRVVGLYEDDQWITMNGNAREWAVAFHGPNGKIDSFTGIGKSRMIAKASANACGGRRAINTATPIPNPGIYFAQNVENCYKTPLQIGNKRYEVAFQCRIHRDHIWETGNGSTWIVVDSPIYVRPYGIVLKEM